jgi:hypothetical protein
VNITSFNVTDVTYHLIGLRVIAALSIAGREEQVQAIARSVLKFARDRALRLMLAEPRGSFESVGDKVCQELVHFGLAFPASRKGGYEATSAGNDLLAMVTSQRFAEVRRRLLVLHLETFANLASVLIGHIRHGAVHSPVVEAANSENTEYLAALLRPTFDGRAADIATEIKETLGRSAPNHVQDALRSLVVNERFPDARVTVPLFRSMCDRLSSLRVLNAARTVDGGCDFASTYSPCCIGSPATAWHRRVDIDVCRQGRVELYISEPDVKDTAFQDHLLDAISDAFGSIEPAAGYHSLPDVRDHVCRMLPLPEAAFDEGVNALMDRDPSPLNVGLTYDGISARRKPLLRVRGSNQLFNLVRRA